MRGHGRKGVADRYLAALGSSPPGDLRRSASASKSIQTTKTKATEDSSPFGTPQREDTSKSPLGSDLFAGPSRAPRTEYDPQVEDLRQYRRRRGIDGGTSSSTTSPWTSESPQSQAGRNSKRRTADPGKKSLSSPPSIVDQDQESSIESASSTELSRRKERRRPRSTLNQVVEKGLEFIFDSTACAAPPAPTPTWKRTAPPSTVKNRIHAYSIPAQDRKTFAAWKRGGRAARVTDTSVPKRNQEQPKPSIPPLSPTQSDLTGVATEVMTNRAYDVAMKRINQINNGVQEAKQRLDRERGDRYLHSKQEMKSLVSVSSNDESSVLRPAKGDRIGQGSGPLGGPNMSFASEQSMTSSVGINVNERIRNPSLQMPILHPPMQRKTYRMPPGSADLCLSPPSIVRKGSSRSVDQRSPDPIFSAKSFNMLSPIRTPGSLDTSFVSEDAMFMEKPENNMIAVPSLDHHRPHISRSSQPDDPPQRYHLQDHIRHDCNRQDHDRQDRHRQEDPQQSNLHRQPEQSSQKLDAAVPIQRVPEQIHSPKPEETNSPPNDNSQSSVAKAFLQAVAKKRGGLKPAPTPPTTKTTISAKLNSPVNRETQKQDDQASVDVKSIRSIFESKDSTAPGFHEKDYQGSDDDTASVKSLKEIFEPSRKKDDQSTGSSVSRLRAKFDAQQKPASKGKFADNDSIAKRSFAMFEARSNKVGLPVLHQASNREVSNREIILRKKDPKVARNYTSSLEEKRSESSEQSPGPVFLGTVEDEYLKATKQIGEEFDEGTEQLQHHSNERLETDKRIRHDPPPMWMDHREVVLGKRFQVGNTDTFHRRKYGDVVTAVAVKHSTHGSSPKEAQLRHYHSNKDANFSSTSSQSQVVQDSDAPSSTDRAQDHGYVPKVTKSSFMEHGASSTPKRGLPKGVSRSFDSSESSDYSDGVTLDASIMEVSVLTNPTELVSKGSRRMHSYDDSDASPISRKQSSIIDQAEVSAKQSEASSSQPSVSAVPLLSKLMKNFPQSDEFSAFASRQSKLERVWSQSQNDSEAIDEAFGYSELAESDELGWDLHPVDTLLPRSEYVTEWEPFELSPSLKADKYHQKVLPNSVPPAETSHIPSLLFGLDIAPSVSTSQLNNSKENAGASSNGIRADAHHGAAESLQSQKNDPNATSTSRTTQLEDSNQKAKTEHPIIAGNHPAFQVSLQQPIDVSKQSQVESITTINARQKVETRNPLAHRQVDSSIERGAAVAIGIDRKQTTTAIQHKSAFATSQGMQHHILAKRLNIVSASQSVDKKRPNAVHGGENVRLAAKTTNHSGVSPVKSYLKAWRQTLEDSKKNPRINAKTVSKMEKKVTESKRYPMPSHTPRTIPTTAHPSKIARQRSIHAEEKDVLKPASNAKDSPRARDFEARSIRRLRMRQMIDLFETDKLERSSAAFSDAYVQREDSTIRTGQKRDERHTFFPATTPTSGRNFPMSDPGTVKPWRTEKGSLSARVVKSLISQKVSKLADNEGSSSTIDHRRTLPGLKKAETSMEGTPSPRTPRSQLGQRFRQRLTPGAPDDFAETSASPISVNKTPTRSNVSYQNDISDHSAAYDIMPYLLPDFEATRPSYRYDSSTASSSTAARSVAPPTSLSSDVVGYASTSAGSSGVHAKSVVGASGHPAYRPKYTALRNRLKSLRESRLRREHNKQEFMASPTGVIEVHPQASV